MMNNALGAGNDNAHNNVGLNALMEAALMGNIGEDDEDDPIALIPEALLANIGLEEDDFRDLAAFFNLPSYYVHYTWVPITKVIMTELLHGMVHIDFKYAARNILAFQLLPGMIELMRRVRNFMKPIDFLRAIASARDASVAIIRTAVAWKQKMGNQEIQYKELTIPFLVAKAEQLIGTGLITKANRILDRVQNMINGVPIPALISDEVFRQKVVELFPVANEFDILPPI
jgi:hypothetical protein